VPIFPMPLGRASCDLDQIIAIQVPVHSMLVDVAVRRESSFPLSDMFASTRAATATTAAWATCRCVVRVLAVFAGRGGNLTTTVFNLVTWNFQEIELK
jgi:exonuclease VII large subunit